MVSPCQWQKSESEVAAGGKREQGSCSANLVSSPTEKLFVTNENSKLAVPLAMGDKNVAAPHSFVIIEPFFTRPECAL